MRKASPPRRTYTSSRTAEIVQSANFSRAGGAIRTEPAGKCRDKNSRGPVSTDSCSKHSGSADKAHGASPAKVDGGGGVVDACGLGAPPWPWPSPTLIRRRSRSPQPETTIAVARTNTVAKTR